MEMLERVAQLLDLVRQHRPVVHAITNWVTAGDVANVLQAIGARPILALTPDEVEEVLAQADALLLNLGTPTARRVETMVLAGRHANRLSKPVVFDPVGAGASTFRKEACSRILKECRLSVIRGNRAEIGTLAGMGGELRGVDACAGPEDLRKAAVVLSGRTGAVVAISGQQDIVTGSGKIVTVENGHPLMAYVTGTGCMLAAVMAAFAAVEKNEMIATVAAVGCFGLAGERVSPEVTGPGSFKVALLDGLFRLTAEEVRKGLRLGE